MILSLLRSFQLRFEIIQELTLLATFRRSFGPDSKYKSNSDPHMNNTDNTERTFSLESPLDRELALARLIDDELTAAQERELLKHLDAQPELWRPCALGFLEERALRRGARGWVNAQDGDSLSVPLAPPVSSTNASTQTLAEPVAPVRAPSQKHRTWLDYTTIAAGLLVAFVGGLIVQQNQPRPLPMNTPVATDQLPPAAPNSPVENKTPEVNPATPLLAKTDLPTNLRLQYVNHTGEPSDKEIDVPLIPMNNIDDSMLASWEQATRQNSIPAETLRLLEQEGQVVRQQNMWLTVDLPNGQQALVPVQRIFVQPRHFLAQ